MRIDKEESRRKKEAKSIGGKCLKKAEAQLPYYLGILNFIRKLD